MTDDPLTQPVVASTAPTGCTWTAEHDGSYLLRLDGQKSTLAVVRDHGGGWTWYLAGDHHTQSALGPAVAMLMANATLRREAAEQRHETQVAA